jgi:methionine-rich copper-binding protein CopC
MKKNKILSFFFVFWLIPALAFAHVGMLNSNPASNGILSSPPDKVTIKMAGPVEPAFSKIEVFNSENKKVSKKTRFLKDNKIMESALKKNLSPGLYTVKWKIMSVDGHSLAEEYTFTIE